MIRYTVEMDIDQNGKKIFNVIKYVEQGAGLVPVCTVKTFTTWGDALHYKTELTNDQIMKEGAYYE